MHSTPLLNRLKADFSQFSYVETDSFRWSAESRTIHIDPDSPDAVLFMLHELGHALLDHRTYGKDIELLQMERDAWHFAVTNLADKYDISTNDAIIQDNLDTYRDWLHTRSLCPSCHMSGLQSGHSTYSCLACGCRWKSNEARNCALRRKTLSY